MTRQFLAIARVVLPLLLVWGCSDMGTEPKKKDQEKDQETVVTFSGTIQPIFNFNCAVSACHVQGHSTGMDLTEENSYDLVVNVVSKNYGPAFRVKPFSPDSSVLYHKVANTGKYGGVMPPGGQISSEDIDLIKTWITEGAMPDSGNMITVIQKLYSDFFPNPIIAPVGQPLRLLVTTDRGEHVNKLRILPFINSTGFLVVGKITTVEFTPQDAGTYQIENVGHGFTGDLIIVEDPSEADAKVIEQAWQEVSLIHSNAETMIYPPVTRVLKGIPLTIYNISLDDEHWVSIEPWVTAPPSTEQGNVRPRAVTTFKFTPTDTGSYVIQHTVHGFRGTLIVEEPS